MDARRHRAAVDEHRATHALTLDAAGPRPLEAEIVAQHIEQRRVGIDGDADPFAVDVEFDAIHGASRLLLGSLVGSTD